MSASNVPQPPRPRRSFRVSLEAALAGLIALALIVMVLAGVFSLGARRLGGVQTAPAVVVPQSHAPRGTPGLQAPMPLPQARARPTEPLPMATEPPAAPDPHDASGSEALVQPNAAPVSPLAHVATVPPFNAAAAPAAASPAVGTGMSLGDYLGFVQFTKIRDAYLNRPDPIVNPTKIQRPQPTDDLAQARSQGWLTPQAARALAARRQAMQSLTDRRARARLDPNRPASPSTQPSAP
jgi:hypothetical protein